MNRLLKFMFIPAILILTMSKGMCQTVGSPPGNPVSNQFFISIGLEPELVATIGFLHLAGTFNPNVEYHIGSSIKFAPLIIANGAWRLNFINAASWKMSEAWKTQITSNLYLAHDNNRGGEMNGLGTELRVMPVHLGNKWAKGADIGWQYPFLTHIKHSGEAKDAFNDRYPAGAERFTGPRDGWYRSAASRLRFGFTGSGRLGKHWKLQLGIGTLMSVQKQGVLLGFSHAQVPFYLDSTVSFNY
jgi:hypothetical protein